MRLATRLIIEEGLEAEVRDALGRDQYEHGGDPGRGRRNGVREARMKTAEGFIGYSLPQVARTTAPSRSELRDHLKGHSEGLEDLAIEMLARGLSVRDIKMLSGSRRDGCCCPERRCRRWASGCGQTTRTSSPGI